MEKRATYGAEILPTLSAKLAREYGCNFIKKQRHIMRFAEMFQDDQIVSTLWRQLNWSHFLSSIPLEKTSLISREAAKKKEKQNSRSLRESTMKNIEDISVEVVDTAIHLHKDLGPGCLNPFMKWCLQKSLEIVDFPSSGRKLFPSNTQAWDSMKAFGPTSLLRWLCWSFVTPAPPAHVTRNPHPHHREHTTRQGRRCYCHHGVDPLPSP